MVRFPLALRVSLLATLVGTLAGCEEVSPRHAATDEADHLDGEAFFGPTQLETFPIDAEGMRVLPVNHNPATRAGIFGGLEVAGGTIPRIEARGVRADGSRGPWRSLQTTWSEDTLFVARAELSDAEVFAGAELRFEAERLAHLSWSAVIPDERPEDEAPTLPAVQGTTQLLRDELTDVINSRADWGARATRCSDNDPNKARVAIHHTVTPATSDPAVRLRGIQAYHMDTRGWCDIGYHFLVSLDGQLWEGRPLELIGAHVLNHNAGNIGISYIGCFHTSGCEDWTPFEPPAEMIEAGALAVATLTDLYDIPIDADQVKGHRDHSGATTSCPGDNLHAQLGTIRSRALELRGAIGPGTDGGTVTPTGTLGLEIMASSLRAGDYRVSAGAEVSEFIQARNIGTATWTPETTFLVTTNPREGGSAIAASDWVAQGVVAAVDREVPPGESGTFIFRLRGPAASGRYDQFFGFKQEGVGYFGDEGQLGPSDEAVAVSLVVDDGVAVSDGGMLAMDASVTPLSNDSGCSCGAAGSRRAPLESLALVVLGLAALQRRRRSP